MADRLKLFTEEEKMLAEKNHDLVYQFLRAHNYNMEDYYNIIVFGYLKGVQKYCRYDGNNTENNLIACIISDANSRLDSIAP